jgi:hypothetical protein
MSEIPDHIVENARIASGLPDNTHNREKMRAALAVAGVMAQSKASRDVITERERQKTVEGWTPDHDDDHDDDALSKAAACYALAGTNQDESLYIHGSWKGLTDLFWPWDAEWWKPKDRRRNLVRAGALILAEIERLDRTRDAP